MPDVITGFIKIYFERKEYERTAKLQGFIESFSKQGKRKPKNKNLNLSEEDISKIRLELGEEKFDMLRSEGETMNLNDAVEYCLDS